MNIGKIFETDFKESAPDYVLMYRLPDSAQSFGGSSNLRFSNKSPFDYFMWDSKRHIPYALELKTVAGKSISFEREKGEHGEIHYHQIAGLTEWDKYDGFVCGFVIFFREIETTIFLDIKEFNRLIGLIDKKSFNFNDLKENGVSFTVIPQTKKRTRYKYGVEEFCESI